MIGQSGYEVASIEPLAQYLVEEKHTCRHLSSQEVVGETEIVFCG
jgi:hypothetical protein